MNNEGLFNTVFQFAEERYIEKTRRNGESRFGHCLSVSKNCFSSEAKIIGLLHDIVEDGFAVFSDLYKLDITDEMMQAVKLLTKPRNISSYRNYIYNLRSNKIAIEVKIQDILDNYIDAKPECKLKYFDGLCILIPAYNAKK